MDFRKIASSAIWPMAQGDHGGALLFSCEHVVIEFGEMTTVRTGFEVIVPTDTTLRVFETHDMGKAGITVVGGVWQESDMDNGSIELLITLKCNRRAAYIVEAGSVIGLASLIDLGALAVTDADAPPEEE